MEFKDIPEGCEWKDIKSDGAALAYSEGLGEVISQLTKSGYVVVWIMSVSPQRHVVLYENPRTP